MRTKKFLTLQAITQGRSLQKLFFINKTAENKNEKRHSSFKLS